MSSTWINKIKCFKTNKEGKVKYAMIGNFADSNMFNNHGGHDYQEGVFAVGDYYEVLKRVCEYSIYFEEGMTVWKPVNKTAEGFIHTCKKALKEAVEQEIIEPKVSVLCTFDNDDERNNIVKIICEKNHYCSMQENGLGGYSLYCNHIFTITQLKDIFITVEQMYRTNAKNQSWTEYFYDLLKSYHGYSKDIYDMFDIK